jgi:hypothetical protein
MQLEPNLFLNRAHAASWDAARDAFGKFDEFIPDENGDVLFWHETDVLDLIKLAQELKAENDRLKNT